MDKNPVEGGDPESFRDGARAAEIEKAVRHGNPDSAGSLQVRRPH